MGALAYVAIWVVGSVGVGVAVGFFLGRGRGAPQETEIVERERQAALKMLLELLESATRISDNVQNHNTEIQENARLVSRIEVSGEMEAVKDALLTHMTTLITSNQDLQQDLICTRYRLEEQAVEIDHARSEARTDDLTGVANRKAFNEKLYLLLDSCRRHDEPFVLMLIDLDQFKRINDAHGHPAGDRVLGTVGLWMKEWVREGDFVGRYGGDEFAAMLPRAELDAGMEIAEKLRSRTAQRASNVAQWDGQITVSLSIGLTVARSGDTAESIIHRADEALYRSKNGGRNQVHCHRSDREDDSVTNAPIQSEPGVPILGTLDQTTDAPFSAIQAESLPQEGVGIQ